MAVSHQQIEYDQLQSSVPCIGRGKLELKIRHEPASACCKAKDHVENLKFECTILGRNINDTNFCWQCRARKENATP